MSDATLCDRCGAVFADEAALRLVTDGDVGGTIIATTKHPGPNNHRVGGELAVQPTATMSDGVTTHEPNWDDLCESCAESLREWWADGEGER
jgi:hypothetical protein